jgi:hypothetical protein
MAKARSVSAVAVGIEVAGDGMDVWDADLTDDVATHLQGAGAGRGGGERADLGRIEAGLVGQPAERLRGLLVDRAGVDPELCRQLGRLAAAEGQGGLDVVPFRAAIEDAFAFATVEARSSDRSRLTRVEAPASDHARLAVAEPAIEHRASACHAAAVCVTRSWAGLRSTPHASRELNGHRRGSGQAPVEGEQRCAERLGACDVEPVTQSGVLPQLPRPLDQRRDRKTLNRKPDQAPERPSDPGSFCIAGPHQSPQCGQHLSIEVGGCRERGPTHPGCHRIATLRSAQYLDHDRCVDHEELRAHATSMSRRPFSTNVTLSGPSPGSGGSPRTSSSHSSRVGRAAWRCRTSTT